MLSLAVFICITLHFLYKVKSGGVLKWAVAVILGFQVTLLFALIVGFFFPSRIWLTYTGGYKENPYWKPEDSERHDIWFRRVFRIIIVVCVLKFLI